MSAGGGSDEDEELIPFQSLGRVWQQVADREDEIAKEVAFIAYHFHWPLEQILNLEHAERRRWAKEISDINRRLNDEAAGETVIASL